ncbi:hypothetical protein LBMAG56_23130 [Verrucomicrobiota bacterium]|nr:hypothetical protein LBMAG56_23130 [Verrucomicrobiota bacterium]
MRHRIARHCPLLAALLAAHTAFAAPAIDLGKLPPPATRNVDFATEIRPLLNQHCLACHGPEKHKNAYRVDIKSIALRGGDTHGIAIIPGQSAQSPLIHYVAGLVEDMLMPPKGERLTAAQIGLLRAWIDQGANWPDAPGTASIKPLEWWSLKPLTRPPVTQSPVATFRIHNPIDAFITKTLANKKLPQSPEADPRTLIRRLYFDLLGLPPTPAEVESFVADYSASSSLEIRHSKFSALVDRLLADPRYGERWARHWLDVVHYGDTHGYDKDKPRPNAWPYRDYVIRAFNGDKPYARFIQEQIAGDVLFPNTQDGIEALGFIAAGPWDFIGHAEVPETKIDGKIARHLDRDDMVANALNTFNSLTVQCAQCHNHKFDPISQQDYYSLHAVFAAIDRADKTYDTDPAIAARRAELMAKQRELKSAKETLDKQLAAAGGRDLELLDKLIRETKQGASAEERPEFGWHSQVSKTQDAVKWVQLDLGKTTAIDRLLYVACHDNFNNIGAGFGFPVRFKIELSDDATFATRVTMLEDQTQADVPNPGVTPRTLAVSGKAGRYLRLTATRLAPRQNDFIFALAEVQAFDSTGKNLALGATVTSLDSIEAPPRWSRKNLTDGYFYGSKKAQPATKLADLEKQRADLVAKSTNPAARAALDANTKSLAEVTAALAKLPAPRVVYAGTVHYGSGSFRGTGADGGKPRPIALLHRGDVKQPRDPAAPGALTALANLPARFPLPADHPEGARRVALAQWLSHPDNPLTWRSVVNRVWQYHFGRGLVETPNDFGRMGALPTHPELLDWLAAEFRDSGQSLKQLHKLIVTSATWRQGSGEGGVVISNKLLVISREGSESKVGSDQSTAPLNRNLDSLQPTHDNSRGFPTNHLSLITNYSPLPSPSHTDSDNRYLWRQNRRKLEAEAVRDSVLLVSGKLDARMGGPAFQDFIVEKPEHSPHYEYGLHDPNDPKSHRRSVYRFIVRSQMSPFMTTLDCADPSMQVGRRNESVSALQALALLNNGFMVAMSRHFAARLDGTGTELTAKIDLAFRLALARPPTPAEQTAFVDYARQHGLPNACRLLINLNEFVFVD